MSRGRFSRLAIGAVVVLALVVLLVPQRSGDDGEAGGEAVLPGLEARINDIDRVMVTPPTGETITAVLDDSRWTIAELDGYPADWPVLRGVLGDLALLQAVEAKTSNPDYYSRLGVEDADSEDAAGTLVELFGGGESWGLIVGFEAERQAGRYVRPVGAAQSLLSDQFLDLPETPVDWVEDTILDIGPGLIAEVSIRHPDGETVRISKVSADDPNFTLRTLPDGREPQSAFKVNALANPFSLLRMEDVRRDPGPGESEPVRVEVVLFSGETYAIDILEWDEERWIRITRAEAADDGEAAEAAPAEADARGAAPEWSGWVFRISETRLDTLTSRQEDILAPLDADGTEQ